MNINASTPGTVLIKGAQIFDGQSPDLIEGQDVLVKQGKITRIGKDIEAPDGAVTLEADGRTLIPGLIDAHWHSLFCTVTMPVLLSADIAYINHAANKAATETLMRGFTTVRDVGGNVFGLKRATDEGLLAGPRIYPSGAFLTQTSGHGDYRGPNDVPVCLCSELSYLERSGITIIADGVPEVTKRAREVLRQGASQLKVMAGGGVSSTYDPLDVTQYTFEELKTIVDVARTWNTYVCVHAFTTDSIRQAIEAGVQCIEHGHLLDDETIRMIADRDVWLSMQPILNDEDAIPFPAGSPNQAKYEQVTDGTSNVYESAKKHNVKLAWGTDVLFDPALAKKQGKLLAKMKRWFTPYKALKQATSRNAELLKLSGPRDPYPGDLGVVQEGALADLILVNGNPLENLDLVAGSEENFAVIMKDGKIYKNTL